MVNASQIKEIWDTCAAGGLSPIHIVEQLSYLVLLRVIEIRDQQKRPEQSLFTRDGEQYRWSYLLQMTERDASSGYSHLRENLFSWLRANQREQDLPGCQVFLQHAHLAIPKPSLLLSILRGIDALFTAKDRQDHTPIYAYLLTLEEDATASSSKPTGRVFTPSPLAELMYLLIGPVSPHDRIWEPCCGNGHLLAPLLQARDKNNIPENMLGCDLDGHCAFEAWMRMFLAGIAAPNIRHTDTLGTSFDTDALADVRNIGLASVIVANPPFSGVTDKHNLSNPLRKLGTTKTELLFLEVILQSLCPGGRAAIIVPEGLLFGTTNAHRTVRQRLLRENALHAIVSLPQDTFAPWANVKTSLLYFQRGPAPQKEVWFYEFSQRAELIPSAKSAQTSSNALDLLLRLRSRQHPVHQAPPPEIDPDLWQQWQALPREKQHHSRVEPTSSLAWPPSRPYTGKIVPAKEATTWAVATEAISEPDFLLSPNQYKPLKPQRVDYPDPATLIRSLLRKEQDIMHGLAQLEKQLEECTREARLLREGSATTPASGASEKLEQDSATSDGPPMFPKTGLAQSLYQERLEQLPLWASPLPGNAPQAPFPPPNNDAKRKHRVLSTRKRNNASIT